MTKLKTPVAVGAAASAKFNKLFADIDLNPKSSNEQSEKPHLQPVCLVCRKTHQPSEKFEVQILRNQKAVVSYSICPHCERQLSGGIQHLRVRLDRVEPPARKRGAK